MTSQPTIKTEEAPCFRCKQTRPVFPLNPEWGRVPDPMCSPCWSKFADARAVGTYVDFADLFDNGTDDQVEAGLGLSPAPASGSAAARTQDGGGQ